MKQQYDYVVKPPVI